MLRSKKFLREYISQTDEYNEHLITSNLINLESYSPPLLVLQLDELNVMAVPPFADLTIENNEDDEGQLGAQILEFVKSTDTGYAKSLKIANLSEVSGIGGKLILKGLTLKLRDMPIKLIDIKSIHLEACSLTLKYVSCL